MGIALSVLLIAAGAILRWAVTDTWSGVDLAMVGLILFVVGIIGFVTSLMFWAFWADRRAPMPTSITTWEEPRATYSEERRIVERP